MRLAPVDAQRFIQGYKLLMLEVLGEQEDRITGSVRSVACEGACEARW